MTELNRKITQTTLRREVELLKIRSGLTDAEKYGIIYNNANLDIVDWLIEKGCSNWEELIKAFNEDQDENQIAKNCIKAMCAQRFQSENILEFIKSKEKELKSLLNLEEKMLVEAIIRLTWPGNVYMIDQMLTVRSVEELMEKARRIEELKVKTKTCNYCKRSGHTEKYCRKRTSPAKAE